MSAPAPKRIDYGKILDLTVLLLWWTIGIVALALFSTSEFDLLRGTFMLLAPVNALYLQIRLVPRLAALAQKGRREELAVTLLPAREYLLGRLQSPFWLAAAPTATLLPLIFTVIAITDGSFFPVGLVFLAVLLSVFLISLAGLADLFARLLKRDSSSGPALLLIPLCWSVAAVVAPIGAAVGAFLLFVSIHGLFGNEEWLVVYGLAFCLIPIAAAIVIAVRRWRTACRRYYQFDFD